MQVLGGRVSGGKEKKKTVEINGWVVDYNWFYSIHSGIRAHESAFYGDWFHQTIEGTASTGLKRLQKVCHEAYNEYPKWHNDSVQLGGYFLPRDSSVLYHQGPLCVFCGFEKDFE